MKSHIVTAVSILTFCIMNGSPLPASAQVVGNDEFSTAGGQVGNMTVFLIHRKTLPKAQAIAKPGNFLTLSEALAQKKLVINETGNVNKLTLQNFGDRPVFIQSGDIVKGGRQDRALQSDVILPARSKLTEVNVFCVEAGRWTQRGSENDKQFATSYEALPSTDLKMSASVRKDQGSVWSGVQKLQEQAQKVLSQPVAATASPSSLQLTLENKKMHAAAQQYVDKLSKVIDGKDDVVGYAVAINGKMTSADVYGSPALFKKMWNKQLSAAATEAFLKQAEGKTAATISLEAVRGRLRTVEPKGVTNTGQSGDANIETSESDRGVLLKTTDASGNLYHKSYLSK